MPWGCLAVGKRRNRPETRTKDANGWLPRRGCHSRQAQRLHTHGQPSFVINTVPRKWILTGSVVRSKYLDPARFPSRATKGLG